ncbi:hypothetical protein FOPE_12711 [Fonsecaea pedrosoi]|nr:hypothetical protein FOPE_12711 [Fonsecaea pedrosoi]
MSSNGGDAATGEEKFFNLGDLPDVSRNSGAMEKLMVSVCIDRWIETEMVDEQEDGNEIIVGDSPMQDTSSPLYQGIGLHLYPK